MIRVAPAIASGVLVAGVAACAGSSKPVSSTQPARPAHSPSATRSDTSLTRSSAPRPAQPSYPRILGSGLASQQARFVPVVSWRGHTAVAIGRPPSGIALLAFDQRLLQLRLHAGTIDPGTSGWRFGPSVGGSERRYLVAAFNGGFKFSTGAGGFMSYGRVAVPLRDGLGSIVTYADGSTDIGAWQQEVPAPGRHVISVRQNLQLLIDHGRARSTLDCITCWGATLGHVIDPARSALGIAADGNLIWAGGEHVKVAQLAEALLHAHVVRAVELDINPEWVAGYLYGHRGGHGPLAPVPLVTGQSGIPGQFLARWSRDFFTIVAR